MITYEVREWLPRPAGGTGAQFASLGRYPSPNAARAHITALVAADRSRLGTMTVHAIVEPDPVPPPAEPAAVASVAEGELEMSLRRTKVDPALPADSAANAVEGAAERLGVDTAVTPPTESAATVIPSAEEVRVDSSATQSRTVRRGDTPVDGGRVAASGSNGGGSSSSKPKS